MTDTPTERGPGDYRWCDARIAALEAEVTRLQGLVSKVETLESKLAGAMKRIEELEERVGKSSRNSNRPPSSDPPYAKPSAKKPPSERKPGGQPGHEPRPRPLAGPEDVGKFVRVVPKTCPHCGGPVEPDDNCPDRHQIWELPKIALWIVEYLLFSGSCKRCGKHVKGELPEGVPRGGFGPRLVAFVALLTGAYRLTNRKAAGLIGDLTGRPISDGSVVACERAVSQAVAGPVAQARAYVEQQPSANVDETSGRQKGKGWLWVAVTP